MKAIITTFIPCTNTKPDRIKAKAEGVPAVIWSGFGNHTGSIEEAHADAARKLCLKYNWKGSMVCGGTPDSRGYAFCFTDSPSFVMF